MSWNYDDVRLPKFLVVYSCGDKQESAIIEAEDGEDAYYKVRLQYSGCTVLSVQKL